MISKLTSDLKKNWKVFLIAVGLMLIADSIGPWEYPKVCVNLQTDVR